MEQFSQKTKEALNYYVYCLVDPRNDKVFYVWKWKWDRVFQHVKCALKDSTISDKLNLIREINLWWKDVKYYIVKHNLTEDESFKIESAIIDLFLNFKGFDFKNIVRWYNSTWEWIAKAEELESIYAAKEIDLKDIKHKLLVININKTYKTAISVYEATRKAWVINIDKARETDYVVSEYKWVSRAIFKVTKRYKSTEHTKTRWCFDWYEETDKEIMELYLNKQFIKKKWTMTPFRYFYPSDKK